MRAILLLALTVAAAGAQTIEVESLFQPAPLSGMWRHQNGDDPRWSDPPSTIRPGRACGCQRERSIRAMDFPGTASGYECLTTCRRNHWL